MRTTRLAQIIEAKYRLTSLGASPNQVVLDVKRELQSAFRIHLMGKDETVKWWADHGYDLAEEFVAVLSALGDPKNPNANTAAQLFFNINNALYLSTQMKHSPNNIRAYRDKLVDNPANKGRLDKRLDKELNQRISKMGTHLRYLDSILTKAAKQLQDAWPELKQFPLQGKYEEQVRRRLSPDEISKFVKFHPEAARYGLNEQVLQKLLMSDGLMYFPEEREKLTTLINAVNRGHTPRNAGQILARVKDIIENEMISKEPNPIHDVPSDEVADVMRPEVGLTPGEQWSQRMQTRKQEVGQERSEEEAAQQDRERIAPLVQQRDLEHQKRQEELQKKQTEQDLMNKYNGLTFNQWMRS